MSDFEIQENTLVDYISNGYEKVVIPFGITRIEDDAFDNEYNYDIEEIIIPTSVYEIGDWAFCDCIALKKIVIPGNVKKLGKHLFAYCESLEEVTLPITFKDRLDETVFEGCFNLKTIRFK